MQATKLLPLKNLFNVAGFPGYILFAYSVIIFIVKRQRSLTEYATVDASAFIQIIYMVVAFGVALNYLMVIKPIFSNLLINPPQIFLLAYSLVCFLSMLWSPNINITIYRSFETIAFLLLIITVVSKIVNKLDAQNALEWAILWIIWELFWSIAVNVKLLGFSYLKWPFESARLSVPMFFFFALMLTKRRLFKYIIIVFSILSLSNKVYFGIAFGLLGYLFGNFKYKAWLILIVIILTGSLFFIDFEDILLNTLFYGRDAVSMSETSGRDLIWEFSFNHFFKQPILGYGFVAGESTLLYSQFEGAISTHNFFLSALLGTGVLGTVPLLIYFIVVFFKSKSKYFPENNWRAAMVSTFIMSLIVSLTAPGVGGRVYGSWIAVVVVFTLISTLNIKFRTFRFHLRK